MVVGTWFPLQVGSVLMPGKDKFVGVTDYQSTLHQQPVVVVREATEAEWAACVTSWSIFHGPKPTHFYEIRTD